LFIASRESSIHLGEWSGTPWVLDNAGEIGNGEISLLNVQIKIRTDRIRLPSIVWQLFWAWIYAPYLLWKVRKIDDLHGWRLQTIICCISG
jgi:hypothetical protein